MKLHLTWLLITVSLLAVAAAAATEGNTEIEPVAVIRSHAIAMNGEPAYGPDFAHFDYVNPQAPKTGTLRQAAIGTFDSLNPFIAKGNPADGLGLTSDTLMVGSADEPFTHYGLIAETIEYPTDRSWVVFAINPAARFHDGRPVTAEDVAFSFETLMEKGSPLYARYYADVAEVEVLDSHRIRFGFGGRSNRELPLILGQLTVLPKHYWEKRDFGMTTLEPPPGTGPYRISAIDPGRAITYTLDDDYWGRDLPVNRGRYNFRQMRFDYYRDATVALAAFLSGEYDFRLENIAKQWATAYQGPPFEQGLIVTESIPHQIPAGMQGFAMNQRRTLFHDRRVRYALAHAFNFEWTNEHLFYGTYRRTRSYFENSTMAATGLPSAAELQLLEPLRKHLWPEVYERVYDPPETRGALGVRRNLRQALNLLDQAGWTVVDGVLRHRESGAPFTFEVLLSQPSFERVVLPFTINLKKLGIQADIRVVDSSQYINRLRDFDFDMIVAVFGQSLSPGNEQRWYWHSEAAQVPGTRNYCGISNPAIDQLVELLIAAESRQELVERCRALDRALVWGHFVIPHWYSGEFRVAYTATLRHPQRQPPYDLALETWWMEPDP